MGRNAGNFRAKIPIFFNIEKNGDGFKSSLNVPMQGIKGIPAITTFANSKITLKVDQLGAEFVGEMDAEG
jgi:hypothetical protein